MIEIKFEHYLSTEKFSVLKLKIKRTSKRTD